jgi:hypothetical protein
MMSSLQPEPIGFSLMEPADRRRTDVMNVLCSRVLKPLEMHNTKDRAEGSHTSGCVIIQAQWLQECAITSAMLKDTIGSQPWCISVELFCGRPVEQDGGGGVVFLPSSAEVRIMSDRNDRANVASTLVRVTDVRNDAVHGSDAAAAKKLDDYLRANRSAIQKLFGETG